MKMWFVSAHEPTSEQIEDANKMGYALEWIKSPVLHRDTDIGEEWKKIFESNPIRSGDAIVVMGAPQWVSFIVKYRAYDCASYDGYPNRVCLKNKEGNKVCLCDIKLYTVFTERNSVEQKMPDGTVKKVSVFKHGGFIRL